MQMRRHVTILGQSWIGGAMSEVKANLMMTTQHMPKAERLLDDLGWASLLTVTGVFWLMPNGHVPSGFWLISVGAIILLFTFARMIYRFRVSEIAFSAGAIALIAGTGSVLGLNLPLFPIALIVIGFSVILVRYLGHRNGIPEKEDSSCCQ